MPAKIDGKYELTGGQNFEEYLAKTGVPPEHIEAQKKVKPQVEVKKNGEEYSIKIHTEKLDKEIKFTLGKEVVVKTPSGRDIKCTFTKDGEKLLEKQVFENGFSCNVEFAFSDQGMEMNYKWEKGTAKRSFKRM